MAAAAPVPHQPARSRVGLVWPVFSTPLCLGNARTVARPDGTARPVGPAHGSQPGTEAGRHAHEGLGNGGLLIDFAQFLYDTQCAEFEISLKRARGFAARIPSHYFVQVADKFISEIFVRARCARFDCNDRSGDDGSRRGDARSDSRRFLRPPAAGQPPLQSMSVRAVLLRGGTQRRMSARSSR